MNGHEKPVADVIPCKGYVGRDGVRRTRLNLGCGTTKYVECVNIDISPSVEPDVILDLNTAALWPFEPDTFNQVYASHILEHIRDPLRMMENLWRVCAPGAIAVFKLPYGSSDNAWEDPTHVRPYFLDSFGYFSQAAYGGADYGYRGDWSIVERALHLWEDKDLESFKDDLQQLLGVVMTHRNIVREFKVVLRCIKPARDPANAREAAPISFGFSRQPAANG
jgi:SAM-dependent methyltransferase